MLGHVNVSAAPAAAVLLVTAGLVGSAIPAAPALADTVEPVDQATRSVVVRYDDLDLTRDEGRRALYHRLDAAAKRACGWYDMRSSFERRTWRACRAAAFAEAVAAVEDSGFAAWAASADAGAGQVEPRIATASQR